MLTYLNLLRLTQARLVATDIVHAIPMTMFAGLRHQFIGSIDFSLLGWLPIGSILWGVDWYNPTSKLLQAP